MISFGNYLWLTFLAALFLGFGCSTINSDKKAASFVSPNQLTATLTNGNNVVLHWKNNATADGGNWVEYTQPRYDWIKLDAFPSDENTTQFFHANLAPRTTFIYHLQPFFGRPTQTVEIITGVVSNGTSIFAEGPIASTDGNPSGEKNPKYSIRSQNTFAEAAPIDLTTTLSSPTSVDLNWHDRAVDADGYLLEISAHGNGDFVPCALLPPNATSFRKTGLPPQTECYFRVRAFFYGKPTDSVSVTTSTR